MKPDPSEFPVPRSRETIILEAKHGNEALALVEVALDNRDLLAEIALGMSDLRSNTEAVAIRAERMIPEPLRQEPTIVQVYETASPTIVNERLGAGWKLLGAATDPHGVTHYSLGKKAKE